MERIESSAPRSDLAASVVRRLISFLSGWYDPVHLDQRLKDYVDVSKKLIFQRQAIFFAATLLGVFYFNPYMAITCYSGVLFTEVMDYVLAARIERWNGAGEKKAMLYLAWVIANTAMSAGAISLFVIMTAIQQHSGGHFTPLFFLFAASLFATMNNHQIIPALIVRLSMYATSFLYIALMDVVPEFPPLSAQPWLQFFTTVFVLYFILDCAVVFHRLYKKILKQLDDLREEHEKTLQAYEVKSKFLSTVSHELRTPLTSIKASVDLINSGALGPVPESMVSILRVAAKNNVRLADLINDLLDIQKFEAGELAFEFSPMSLNELVHEATEANKAYADQLGITIETHLPDADLLIDGDKSRLMQVMANLISNALKFSQMEKRISISVKRVGDRARILVEDFGVGIAEGAKDLVFGRFTQIDSSDQRRVGGTGLGMHISKQIVERHNGVIDYVSQHGRGTTFFVDFNELVGVEQHLSH
ncbi:MAG: HAMP domain-containing sensor histidine kinase [bacterium]